MPLLINNKRIVNHYIWIKVQAAGLYGDSFDDKPVVHVKIDTGFSGWLILPLKAKYSIDEPYLNNLYRPVKFSQYKNNSEIIIHDSYILKMRIVGDAANSVEIAPDYTIFYDKPYGVIGMKLLEEMKSVLNIDVGNGIFSLDAK
jgi:predicted aspartyl protease